MQAEIHPKYAEISVSCSCGNKFSVGSTLGHDLTVDVCDKCHPFYTGQQKLIDTTGRVERFKQRYASIGGKAKPAKKEAAPAVEQKAEVKKEVKPAAKTTTKAAATKKAATKKPATKVKKTASTASKAKKSDTTEKEK